ncbi:SNF family Na+-dependent transporter [Thermanaerovibrio velox DSM 12556]|uniref:Transporter n=1 Tax=Thermanaerovibrio velox DSM 12556 TaxID=926567 RepID=H0UQ36_9BACT|nr:sodium-dependent transporter [Thermanaerovibrio velox]EHM09665.1 SNF family Na+-dependent transporter [Thermanaerovibrio velox DSM 12556]
MSTNDREQWGSRLGFIMAAAGSAVGLGNIWRFPYVTGMNGGGAFVLIYLLIVFTIGASVMLAEMAIGRGAGLNAVGSFKKLRGGAWPLVGWMGVIAGFIILSFYGVVAGWTIAYMIKSFTGLMEVAAQGKAGDAFGAFVSNPTQVILYQAIFMLGTIWIVFRGIGEGIEKYCKVMMPALFLLLLVLIVRAVTLDGAMKGLEFYLKPDFSKVTGKTILDALGQGFFSLSLGMGCMITYGSYLSKDEALPSAAFTVTFLDTMVAFLAGFAIFPAVFAFNMEPAAGPGLTFITLPSVFSKMPMGAFFSFVFFLLLFFAAITSSVSLLEVCVAYFKDELGWDRAKASWILGLLIFLLGIPSALSLGGHFPKVLGKDFLDLMDYLSSNVLLPLGGIFISIFAGWIWLDGARAEATSNGRVQFAFETAWVWICRVVAPLAVAIIFIKGVKG